VKLRLLPLALAIVVLAAPAGVRADEVGVTLSGSRASMLRQNRIAKEESFTFLRTTSQVLSYVNNGHLVPLTGNENYAVIAGHPYARPVVRTFIERLARDYRDGCGERLVVTSLTRPATRQPSNASPLSVHPAGMAVDLRYSANAACRGWLSLELLRLETAGLLDATLERSPPHFHVAVFPRAWEIHEQRLAGDSISAEAIRLLEEAVAARNAVGGASLDAAHEHEHAVVMEEEHPGISGLATSLVRFAAFLARIVLPVRTV
jgi:hypothetical protein